MAEIACPLCNGPTEEHEAYRDRACPSCGLAAPPDVLARIGQTFARAHNLEIAMARADEDYNFQRDMKKASRTEVFKRGQEIDDLRDRVAKLEAPIPMLLFCPVCSVIHIDAPDEGKGWTNPPHRSHECQACGHVWRPADVATTGVFSLETRGQRDGSPIPRMADHDAERIAALEAELAQLKQPAHVLAEAERLLRAVDCSRVAISRTFRPPHGRNSTRPDQCTIEQFGTLLDVNFDRYPTTSAETLAEAYAKLTGGRDAG